MWEGDHRICPLVRGIDHVGRGIIGYVLLSEVDHVGRGIMSSCQRVHFICVCAFIKLQVLFCDFWTSGN